MSKKAKQRFALYIFTIIIIAFGAYLFGWARGESFDPTSTYEAPAHICEVNEATGWVTLVDWDNEVWCIRGEGYEVGQLVIVVFNDNNTESIYDDLIVEVKCVDYIGEVE